MENSSGLAVWNGATETLQYWTLYALNSSTFVSSILTAVVVLICYPYIAHALRRVNWWSRNRVRRARGVGIYNNYALRFRLCDLLVDAIDRDYLDGKISHKTRQALYKDLGEALGLRDLLPTPKFMKLHPRKMEMLKREAKKRLGLDPDKPLHAPGDVQAEADKVVELKPKRARKLVTSPPIGVKVG